MMHTSKNIKNFSSQGSYFDSRYGKIFLKQEKTKKVTYVDIYKNLFAPIEISRCIRGDRNSFGVSLLQMSKLKKKKVLDYGCGIGDAGLLFALCGANAFGFDISIEGCKLGNLRAKISNLNFVSSVMSADSLAFKEESFDYVFGIEIVHHIMGLPNLGEELWRILKPGGKAIFCEGLGMNPLINFYRKWKTKKKQTAESEGNPRILDYLRLGKMFNRIVIYPMHLTFMVKTLFGWRIENNSIIRSLVILRQLDKLLLKVFPFLKCFCGEAVILYEK